MSQLKTSYLKPADNIYTVFVVDNLISPILPFLARTSITPNQITGLSFVAYMCSAIFFFLGYLIGGAICFQLGFILDCIDGKLARLKQRFSRIGGWLDTIVDRIGISLNALALGIHESRTSDRGEEWIWYFLFVVIELITSISGQYVNGVEKAKAPTEKAGEREVAVRSRFFIILYEFRDWLREHRLAMPPIGTVEAMTLLFVFAPLFGIISIGIRIAVVLMLLINVPTALFYWKKEILRELP